MEDNSILKYIIENKQEMISYLIVLLLSVSLFTIGYVIYRFFFWQPPITPFVINISNFTR